MDQKKLIELAASLARPFTPSEDCTSGTVAAALVTAESNIFTGVCLETACSLGFCAEHAAVAEMLKARQSVVRMIVAVDEDGKILPPCGRCRELLWEVDDRNQGTWVVLDVEGGAWLRELLPRR
ncbi:MAG: cytidine deaminase family protein [Terriglobia bacterium]